MFSNAKRTVWYVFVVLTFSLSLTQIILLWRWTQPQPEAFNIFALLKGVASPPPPQPPALDYKDFVSILLTALSIMIAIGALFFAFIAVIGYKEGVDLITRLVNKRLDEVLQPKANRASLDASLTVPTSDEANEIAASLDDDDANRS